MNRLPGWRSALFAAIEARRGQPYESGAHDCALFAADCVKAITGVDLVADYRGRYANAAQGLALLAARGFADQVELVAALLPEVKRSRAQVGDVAIVEDEAGHPCFGVVAGSEIMVLKPSGEIGAVPFGRAVRAFKVG